MKKLLSIPILAAALLPAAPASAEPVGVYIAPRLSGGQVKFHFKYAENDTSLGSQEKWTYGSALAAGYDFYPAMKFPARLELEYGGLSDAQKTRKFQGAEEYNSYRYEYDTKIKTTLGVRTLFVNAYFDWHNASAFTPYVNLGLGMSFLDAKTKVTDIETIYSSGNPVGSFTDMYHYGKKTTINTAWNIGLGGAWRLSDVVALDLGYRYANLGKAKTKVDDPSWSSGDYFKTKTVETHQFLLGARILF